MRIAAWLTALLAASSIALPDDYALTPLDDFEDVSPWVKGDPNTDLTQKDAAVVGSTERAYEGKQSLCFMIQVNWTPRGDEEYPKGWPMMSRTFAEAQDWTAYDAVQFQLYTETEARIPEDRAFRCGFQHGGEGVVSDDWYSLPGIEPGQWQPMTVPLDPRHDWSDVTGISFYVAEQWYQDGDRIDFYVDDMRLASRLSPRFHQVTTSARTEPRGTAITLEGAINGPPRGVDLRWRLVDEAGEMMHQGGGALESRILDHLLPLAGAPGGSRTLTVELGSHTDTIDSKRQFLRTLEPGKRCYLSLISFYNPTLFDATPEELAVLNDSAYEAVAIRFWGGYDASAIPPYDELKPHLNRVREALDIDPWPWVFSNRLIGAPEDGRGHASKNADDPEYFRRIPILDLDNETGARGDFLTMFRHAVRAAREWGVPGVVVDLEAYNNYYAYQVSYVAERRGEHARDVVSKCEGIGADMARICEEEFPECIVWSLFSRLERPTRLAGVTGPVYTTPGHMTLGFLKYAKQHKVPCKFLCGGETTPGYYNPNVERLKARIAGRDAAMAGVMARFPNHLYLAGTISPYHDHRILTDWILRNAGDDPELKTIEDFQPMFRTLFDAYDWVWIYASSAARTQPYNPDNNARYSAVLKAALDESAGAGGGE